MTMYPTCSLQFYASVFRCEMVTIGEVTPMTTNSKNTSPPARQHRDYYTALYQAALTISSSLELSQVLQSVVTSITEAMRVKACVLRLLDPRTGQLRLSAVYGLSSEYLAKGPVSVTDSPIDSEAL